MLKVLKFGGSSMADAHQLEKVRSIVEADPARRVVVVSAAGKRDKNDHKITDLLYLCHAHLQYGVSCDAIFQMIADRYIAIRDECGLNVDIEAELAVLRQQMRAVMRYAGPRMLLSHPILVLRHMAETMRRKRRNAHAG